MIRRPLWSAAEAADATGGISTADWKAFGVSIDTRTIAPGDLFVALAGPRFDGHDFVADAFERGAAAALIHRRPEKLDDKAPLLQVDDTLGALWRLGAAARERSEARFVGITGSVGKTGTKEALAHCLSAQEPTAWSPGSFNNQWGLPLSLARITPEARYGVFELGMNHPGEIRELVRLLKPQVAMVLNIEAAHIGYFASLEEIAAAKAEIFETVEPDGSAIINRDSPFFEVLAARARACGIDRIVGFGRHIEAEARLIDSTAGEISSDVTAIVAGKRRDFRIALPGQHWIANALAVLAAVAELGGDVGRAADALGSMKPIKG
ncbi:MAG: UDP-N-acetylmuramoyl-tripeptide--D-alanyl-D-alanine ligase, partial [Kiloniellales bacterium]